ncbi:hypothetical protein [Microvirga sp. CF3016]|uniref:hypothetical protein n=1 Tax=Microvirga sp. CF3016 TaxID=3110181 RepID=UPI002E7AAB12|nr:hypothetical protein [Microvirga sp. CF3016]MEE1612075.1 hypothetical protein [Microvirga sp. CF3016]
MITEDDLKQLKDGIALDNVETNHLIPSFSQPNACPLPILLNEKNSRLLKGLLHDMNGRALWR